MENKVIIEKIQKTIECNDKYCKAYFWSPGTSASQRRRNEEKFSETYEDYDFDYNGNHYDVKFHYDESCNHCYYKLIVLKNGYKTNITPLKTILKKVSSINEIRKEKIKSIL
jgi:hypothetical protein